MEEKWPRLALAALTLALLGLVVPASAMAVGSISGTVSDEAPGHAPLERVRVCAFGDSEEEEFKAQLGVNCELTDSSGDYTIHNLPADEYVVDFWPGYEGLNYVAEFYDDEISWSEADKVAVTTTAKTGIDAELTEGGELHGKVIREAGGTPVAGVLVCAEEEEAPWYFECAETDGAGEYTMPGLPAGEYWVEFWPEGGDLLYQFHNGVAVALGATTTENAALAPGAEITGQVTDAVTSAGVSEVFVCATEGEEELFRCAETGFTGLYSLSGLLPGTYKVVFAPFANEVEALGPEVEYKTQFFNNKSTWLAADPIALASGGTKTGVNAALVKKKAAATNTLAPSLPQVLPTPRVAPGPIKKLHCRKGFKKRMVKGREKCVKAKKKAHRRSGPGAHGHDLHLRSMRR